MKRIAFLCLVLFLVPEGASPQSILLEVSASETGAPIQGAFATLLDPSGNAIRSGLTNGRGQFLFTLPGAGEYRIRAEMLGRETVETEPIHVEGSGGIRHQIRLSHRAIPLTEIQISADRVCEVRPAEASLISSVWEEARKALSVLSWGDSLEVFRYQVERYSRSIDLDRGTTKEESRRMNSGFYTTPFESRPASNLFEDGFVEPHEDGDIYYAPDAAAILSDAFLNAHCLGLAAGNRDHTDWIGITFEPIPGRRTVDIRGELWIERDSGELKQLDFRYENLPPSIRDRRIAGRVEFARLPRGHWIVKRWWIRMPTVASSHGVSPDREPRLVGLREEGAEVMAVRNAAGALILEADRATIEGMVLEQQSTRPQVDVAIRLAGTDLETRTNRRGEFRFTGIPEGTYEIQAESDLARMLGLAPTASTVSAVPGQISSVNLSLPPPEEFIGRACSDLVQSDSPVLVTGQVKDAASGEALLDAKVELWWSHLPGDPRALRSDTSTINDWSAALRGGRSGVETWTGRSGRFAICGPGAGHPLTILAKFGPLSSDTSSVRVESGELIAARDLIVRTEGSGSLTGIVVAQENDEPLPNAEVTLAPNQRTAVTDRNGMFHFRDLPLGKHRMSVELLGRATATDSVIVGPGQTIQVEVRLPMEAIEIEGIVVEVMRGALDARRAEGRATNLVTRSELAEIEDFAPDLTNVLRRKAGNRLRITAASPSGGFVRDFCVQSSRRSPSMSELSDWPGCRPVMLIVNGVMVWAPSLNGPEGMPRGEFREILTLPPDQIEDVELLSPMEGRFQYGALGRFGVLLINTRRGGG